MPASSPEPAARNVKSVKELKLSVCHVNIRSLNSCFDDFCTFVIHSDYDLIGLSETWLTDNDSTANFTIQNYSLVRSDRPTRGGGVCWYISKNIKYKKMEINYAPGDQLEQLWILANINNKKVAFGVVYRPPNLKISSLDMLEEVLTYVVGESDDVILAGDLNVDFSKKDSCNYIYLQNIFDCFNLIQLIQEPTRIAESSSTLIDIICTDQQEKVIECGTIDLLNMTDHFLTYATFDYSVVKLPIEKITYRDYRLFDRNEFAKDASAVNWMFVQDLPNIEEKNIFLSNAIKTIFDIHAPYRTITPQKPSKPYITETIREISSLKHKAYKQYKKTKSELKLQFYKDLRNYLSLAIRNEKIAYINHQIENNKNNARKLWQNLGKFNVHIKPKNLISSDIGHPNDINIFFSSITQQNVNLDTLTYYQQNVSPMVEKELTVSQISVEEIENALNLLKSNAFGADGINLKMLKLIFPFCKYAITHIINASFESGTLPRVWKQSIIIPLAKINVATEFGHLRPINILSAMSKLVEKVISIKLIEHLKNENILPLQQSGFRKQHSTSTSLMKISDDLTCAIDKSKVTYLVLLDYSKAFDLINHDLLLGKLHYYKVSSRLLNWFKCYLSNRSQVVKIDNSFSSEQQVSCGVPQGSILGPLMFTIFTADLPSILSPNCRIHLYADDTQIYVSCNPSHSNEAVMELNQNLVSVVKWSSDNGLIINPSKSTAMCIGTSAMCNKASDNLNSDLILNENVLVLKQTAKNIGVIFDDRLCFENHVTAKCQQAYAKFKTLYKFKYVLPSDVKWKILNTVILSNFDYCSGMYYWHLTKSFKNKIQILQNACLRYAYNIDRRHHITPYYNNHNLLKVDNRFIMLFSCLLYNIVNQHTPPYLYDLLELRSQAHEVNIRTFDSYSIPKHYTTKYESCFSYMAPKILNKFHYIFISSPTMYQFKQRMKQTLLTQQNAM